ncbi:biosynthetic-type acetolactate synthase large subunit [Dethiobacter alkaliphilus]|uniref:biosynthetic-type acetolactate synthase large subunit n=1 Tax=Dethiobacter alkaliphilus TaxID=427926 RepID=UPI002226DE65|nr:biosynthetic-type acetolactate synthase large subunit [Dethiobacter alkaliphilus]MCW3488989.1 biosynthetic-type acetolactate synthase large subunit [Dethiobacter alkaliphilus]
MKIPGAQMIIESLKKENVDVIFGYPGGAVLNLYDQLYDADIRHIMSRHEQGAIHAADGYSRMTGRPGVVFATSGPGATNLVTGIATAYMDSVPMVVFTGQVASPLIGTDAFQEADIFGITLPITKHNYLVTDVEELPRIIKEAFYLATTGRRGPVLIDLPKDVQQAVTDFRYPDKVEIPGYNPTYEGHPGQITRAAKAIGRANKPVIYAGGGVVYSEAHQELLTLAEKAQIPVTTTLMGLSGFPGNHPLSVGMLGMHGMYWANMAMHEADLIIAIGARFDDRVTGKLSHFAKNAKIIHIDIDPAEIGKNVKVDIPVVGDVKRVLCEVLKKVEPKNHQDWLSRIEEWRKEVPLGYNQEEDSDISPQYVIEMIYQETDGEALITTEVGQHQMWTAQYYKFNKPRSFASSGGLGTMGYGFPASLGAQVARPGETVFCIAGDGSFQMNSQELATAVEYNIPVKVAIINNQFLGMVRQWQQMFFKRRYSSVVMEQGPDFVKLAEAYGATGLRAEKPSEVTAVIKKALETPGPVVMDFRVRAEENVFPMVPPNCPICDMVRGEE